MKKQELEADQQEQNERVAQLFGLSEDSPTLLTALTHPSYAHEYPGETDNQRLEFLGDAILDFVVSEQLFKQFESFKEGQLTRLRSQLVSTQALCRFAKNHELGAALRLGKGAGQGTLRESENVLADAVEALIAACYLDHGIEEARRSCGKVFEFGLRQVQKPGSQDSKSELQERVQALGLKAPTYQVLAAEGPAHEVMFEVEVSVNQTALAQGRGRSKRLAERSAAELALDEKKYEQLVEQWAAEAGLNED